MFSSRVFFFLQLTALWIIVVVLTIITAVAFIASGTRSDCSSLSANASASLLSLQSQSCTWTEEIASAVHQHNSYFQSVHIMLIQGLVACCLLVFSRSLWAMTWSGLEPSMSSNRPKMTIATLQRSIDVVGSPGILASLMYSVGSHSVNFQVLFVFFISILSLVSPIALSPVYQAHHGPYSVQASIIVGGGEGDVLSPSFNADDPIPVGVEAGRALINAQTVMNATVPSTTPNVNIIPFIPQASIGAIWSAQIQTIVARSVVDCGQDAPGRLSNSTTESFITLDPQYFAPNGASYQGLQVLFSGQSVGTMINDAKTSVAYLNTTFAVAPGSVEAQTTVIFIAANGTLEGAQGHFDSPNSSSRIAFIEVLACTSSTTLEISKCNINDGKVTNCDALLGSDLPLNATTSPTGGVEMYITHPKYVANYLAASPVTAYYNLKARLPMYGNITDALITSQLPPLSYLSIDTNRSSYHIPLNYTTNVLFGQTAQGLVQGLLTTYSITSSQQISITAVFGTSQPALLLVIMGLCLVIAVSTTFFSTIPLAAQQCVPLDVVRLLAISRNPQIDMALEPYTDRTVEIGEDVLETPISYEWVEELGRRVIVLGGASSGSNSSLAQKEEGYTYAQVPYGHSALPNPHEGARYTPVESEISS